MRPETGNETVCVGGRGGQFQVQMCEITVSNMHLDLRYIHMYVSI